MVTALNWIRNLLFILSFFLLLTYINFFNYILLVENILIVVGFISLIFYLYYDINKKKAYEQKQAETNVLLLSSDKTIIYYFLKNIFGLLFSYLFIYSFFNNAIKLHLFLLSFACFILCYNKLFKQSSVYKPLIEEILVFNSIQTISVLNKLNVYRVLFQIFITWIFMGTNKNDSSRDHEFLVNPLCFNSLCSYPYFTAVESHIPKLFNIEISIFLFFFFSVFSVYLSFKNKKFNMFFFSHFSQKTITILVGNPGTNQIKTWILKIAVIFSVGYGTEAVHFTYTQNNTAYINSQAFSQFIDSGGKPEEGLPLLSRPETPTYQPLYKKLLSSQQKGHNFLYRK